VEQADDRQRGGDEARGAVSGSTADGQAGDELAGPGAIQTRNKSSIRRFVEEALNRGNLQVVDETRGEFAEGGKRRIEELRSAFPDLVTTIHPIIAEGDWVAHRMVHTGTHLGPFRGIAATGRRVEFTSIAMNRFHAGVVVENWGLHDISTVLAQIQPAERG
jgi:predicted ester cyclase